MAIVRPLQIKFELWLNIPTPKTLGIYTKLFLACFIVLSTTTNGVNDTKRCQRQQTVSTTPNCVNDNKLCQWHQTVSMTPNDFIMTEWSHVYHKTMRWPFLLLVYDWWHGKGTFCVHLSFQISRNSFISSLSSSVNTTSQQLRSVCLIMILGISHVTSATLSSSGCNLSSSSSFCSSCGWELLVPSFWHHWSGRLSLCLLLFHPNAMNNNWFLVTNHIWLLLDHISLLLGPLWSDCCLCAGLLDMLLLPCLLLIPYFDALVVHVWSNLPRHWTLLWLTTVLRVHYRQPFLGWRKLVWTLYFFYDILAISVHFPCCCLSTFLPCDALCHGLWF